MKYLTTSIALCIGLLSASGANAALVSALGGKVVNDTDFNITWLANANLAATNTFGLAYGVNYGNDSYGTPSIIDGDGLMTWGGAQKCIAAMNAANYLGYNDWRLPTTLQPDASCDFQSNGISTGPNCTGSEMGHLFYTELGSVAGQNITTAHNANYSLFNNVQSDNYWSGTEYAPNPAAFAWDFNTDGNTQYGDYKGDYFNALAVRPGQVAVTPLPASAWLFGSGLLGLIGLGRQPRLISA